MTDTQDPTELDGLMSRLAHQHAEGLDTTVLEVVPGKQAILVGLSIKRPVAGGSVASTPSTRF
jgi:hypothetical protein